MNEITAETPDGTAVTFEFEPGDIHDLEAEALLDYHCDILDFVTVVDQRYLTGQCLTDLLLEYIRVDGEITRRLYYQAAPFPSHP